MVRADPNAKYLVEVMDVHGGTDRHYKFPNGYEASVIDYGYGSKGGLKEMAVWKEDSEMVVEGWLTDAAVVENLRRIRVDGDNAVFKNSDSRSLMHVRLKGPSRRRPEVHVRRHPRRQR
jgi:hypothetical protein